MFEFFKKKSQAFPIDSKWSVGQSTKEEKQILVRRNTSAIKLVGHIDYKFRIGVAIPLGASNSNEFLIYKQMELVNSIEDQLWEELEKNHNALHVLTISSDSMREFIFYSRSPDISITSIESIRQKTQTFEIQSYIAEDPKWDVYTQFS
jgi:hypothetical protein